MLYPLQSFFSLRSSATRRGLKKALQRLGQLASKDKATLFKSTLQNANSLFLEFTFGWTPLAHSIQDAYKVFTDQLNGTTKTRKKVTGIGYFVTDSDELSGDTSCGPSTYPYSFNYNVSRHYVYKCIVGGILKPSEQQAVPLADKIGLNARSIIPTVWAIANLSFLADYFANIGDVLNNIKQSVGRMIPESLYMTEIWEYTSVVNFAKPISGLNEIAPPWTYTLSISLSNPCIHKITVMRRTPLSPWDTLVSLNARIPSRDQLFKTLSVALSRSKLLV